MSDTTELLQASFHQLLGAGADFIADLYDHLFAAAPEARGFFAAVSLDDQRHKLLMTLALIIEQLENPPALAATLRRLGSIHADHQVPPALYSRLGESLLACLPARLGPSWTPEMRRAWADGYQQAVDAMLGGYEPPH